MPTIYNKRGLSNALNAVNPVLGSGEIVHVIDTNTLVVGNGSGVFSSLSGINATPLTHSHVVSDITNFNTSVSGLLPTIANSGDNRVLTSTGSSVGINAESNLTFDGTNLNLNNQTASTIASFDSSKNLVSLSTATYPSLTELSYVKGVTSALQTQIDTKATTSTTITAGSGLAGGGSLAANRTIDIGQGDGITVSADSIAVDSTVIRTTGVQTMSGAKTFSAQTVFSSGTAAAPGISIIGDTDTGIAQLIRGGESANTLSLVVGGTERMRIEPGNVKILTPTDDTAEFSISNSIDRDAYVVIDGGSNAGRSAILEGRANGAQEWYICSTRFHEDGPNNGMALNVAGSNPMTFRTNNTEKMRITSDGNVGIGTTSPPELLSVFKDNNGGRTSILIDNLDQRLKMSCYYQAGVGQYSEIQSTNNAETGHQVLILNRQGGNVAIGTTNPSAKLLVSGSGEVINGSANGGSGTTNYGVLGQATGAATNNTGFYANASNATNNYGVRIVAPAAGANNWAIYSDATAKSYFAGNTGIGVQPTYRFEVRGSGATSSTVCFYISNSSATALLYIRDDGAINTGAAAVSPYNNVTGTAANLVVGSDGFLYRSTSSLRYKTQINDATHGLNEVLKLRSVTFKSQNDGNKIFGGLIAEEVDSAGLTEFVQYDSENRPDAIHYSNMVALLVKAIQEQQTQINELKNRLSALEGE